MMARTGPPALLENQNVPAPGTVFLFRQKYRGERKFRVSIPYRYRQLEKFCVCEILLKIYIYERSDFCHMFERIFYFGNNIFLITGTQFYLVQLWPSPSTTAWGQTGCGPSRSWAWWDCSSPFWPPSPPSASSCTLSGSGRYTVGVQQSTTPKKLQNVSSVCTKSSADSRVNFR